MTTPVPTAPLTRSTGFSLLDAVPTIHSVDCGVWGGPQSAPTATIDAEAIPEDVVAYVSAARKVYDDLRALIGQVAGLMILAQASGKREAFDLPTFAAARERWSEVAEAFGRLTVPRRLDANLYRLKLTHRLIGQCIDALKAPRLVAQSLDLTAASADLSAAYAHLQAASEPRVGMTMVDFNHACCSCGRSNQ